MGSKRLKAIVAKGSKQVEYHDHKKVVELNRSNYERAKVSQVFQARSKYGTPLTLNFTHTGGILPTKNFQYGTWDKALGKIDSVGVYKSVKSHRSCQSCFVHCSLITEVAEGKYKGTTLEGPEYETLGMFGSNLLIDSLPTVIQANVLCDKLGLDTISAGNVIGFAMECFEKGLLTAGQMEGLELNFGDDEACLAAIEMIADRQGIRGYPGAGRPGGGRSYRRRLRSLCHAGQRIGIPRVRSQRRLRFRSFLCRFSAGRLPPQGLAAGQRDPRGLSPLYHRRERGNDQGSVRRKLYFSLPAGL